MTHTVPPTTPASDMAQLLARFPALQGLDDAGQRQLLDGLLWSRLPRGTGLFAEGDRCRAFPLLLSGEIQVARTTPDGHEIELYRIGAGESCIVSTSCLLGDAHYPARGLALSDVVLAALPHRLFDALITAHPPFRHYVFGLFSERLARMMQRVEEIAFRSLTRRLAALLLDRDTDCLDTTHERLAAQIGASREAVSRALKKLEDARCIALARGRICVADRARLAAER